jgi:flagella basal body P-ring formation protein FlgA
MMKQARLALAAMLWLMGPAVAIVTAGDSIEEITSQIRVKYLDDQHEYTVSLGRYRPPGDGYDSVTVEALPRAVPRGNFPVKLRFFKQGRLTKTANLAAYIGVRQSVLVADNRIDSREALDSTMFSLTLRDISRLRDTPVTSPDQLIDMCAGRTIRAGQILTERMLRKRDLVKRGDRVQIEYAGGAVMLTAVGEARENGARGDLIKVMNLSSNRTIVAEVSDEETVKVAQ